MSRVHVTPLQGQLRRARRRLFLQALLDALALTWAVVLVLMIGWVAVRLWLLREELPAYRWAVLGGALGAATAVGLAVAVRRRPSPLTAALELDARFHLAERVTTALTLGPGEAASPAGQALLADLNTGLAGLRVGDRFPVRWRPCDLAVPLGVLVLVPLALFGRPLPRAGHREQGTTPDLLAPSPALKADIARKMRELRKRQASAAGERPRSAELQRLEAELDKLAHRPTETKEQARKVVQAITTLEDRITKREKQMARRADGFRARMKRLELLSKKGKKDGPAKDFDKALGRGDFRKARDEVDRLRQKLKAKEEAERLRKKLKDKDVPAELRREMRDQLDKLGPQELTREQQEELQRELQDLKNRLGELDREREERDRLRERMAKLTPEERKELERLEAELAKFDPDERKALMDLASKLGAAEKLLREGKLAEAEKKLAEMGMKLGEMDRDAEGRALALRLRQLRAARRAVCRALDARNPGGPASGRRPAAADGKTEFKEEFKEERAASEMDRGRLRVIDHVPGDGFKGPRNRAEMAEDIRRAAQEAPEAIDRQRLPRSASDMARGYFEKLRGPDKDAKPKGR